MNEIDSEAPKARGKKRMKELSKTYEQQRIELEAAILAGREEPDALARVAAECLSSAIIGARRKRAAGRNDADMLRIAAQWMRASGLKPPPAGTPAPVNIFDQLSALADDDEAAA